jgi:hypothetical protein
LGWIGDKVGRDLTIFSLKVEKKAAVNRETEIAIFNNLMVLIDQEESITGCQSRTNSSYF